MPWKLTGTLGLRLASGQTVTSHSQSPDQPLHRQRQRQQQQQQQQQQQPAESGSVQTARSATAQQPCDKGLLVQPPSSPPDRVAALPVSLQTPGSAVSCSSRPVQAPRASGLCRPAASQPMTIPAPRGTGNINSLSPAWSSAVPVPAQQPSGCVSSPDSPTLSAALHLAAKEPSAASMGQYSRPASTHDLPPPMHEASAESSSSPVYSSDEQLPSKVAWGTSPDQGSKRVSWHDAPPKLLTRPSAASFAARLEAAWAGASLPETQVRLSIAPTLQTGSLQAEPAFVLWAFMGR